ncbi:RNA-directed DNA polymerase from mobile element jockey [Turdus rufiventris]|nr:RNA-directed DNA polymerase from mobile element jockey [Turdus rufiventris]
MINFLLILKTVQDLLLLLYPYKPVGPGKIDPRIPKELADVTAEPLLIFELSWETRAVPANWKLANIIPIFKKGKKEEPRNYRPASLTLVPGKVKENIILRDTEKYLKDNAVIGHIQHGFMGGKS